jgi:hypothetical protein
MKTIEIYILKYKIRKRKREEAQREKRESGSI